MQEPEEMDLSESVYEEFVQATHDHSPETEEKELGPEPRKKQKTDKHELLSFKKGDCIKVISKDRSGWWYGQKYLVKSKELVGNCAWFPPSYTKSYFTSLKPTQSLEKSLVEASQYPADFFNSCYVNRLDPLKASAKGLSQQFFRGLPLLETLDDGPDVAKKAVKELNQHFDYEKWNEHMNKIDPKRRKAKPNPKLKKEKKIRW
jgi:hypothetical protein